MKSWDRSSVAINKKFFSTFNCLCYIIDQSAIENRNPFNKAYTDETVENSKYRRTDVFYKQIVTKLANQFPKDA